MTENRVWEKESLKKLLDKVNDYRDLGVKNVLQIELLARLAAGRSTASDLAVEVFSGNNPGAVSRGEYMRTMRSLAALERKGHVTRALFGKEKPYRLTHHGEDAVEAIIGGRTPQALIPRREFLSFALAGFGGGHKRGVDLCRGRNPDPDRVLACNRHTHRAVPHKVRTDCKEDLVDGGSGIE